MKKDKSYKLIEDYERGYGHFKTIPVIKSILKPASEIEELLLIDSSLFRVSTDLVYFKNVLANSVGSNLITKEYQNYCLNNLQLCATKVYSFSKYLPIDEHLFEKFKQTVFKEAALFIWNKEQNNYVSEISNYQIIDHPAVGSGTKYECFFYYNIELYKYMIGIF